jgi:hypothetical protein
MPSRRKPENARIPLSSPHRERFDRLVERHGHFGTAKRLGLVPLTIEVLMYGGVARPWTVRKVVEALERLPRG